MPTGIYLRKPVSKEVREKLSKARIGMRFTEEHKRNLSIANKGKRKPPFTAEHRKNMANAKKGDKTNLWKGGVTPINKRIRASTEYRQWREAVFKRDGYKCVWCKGGSGKLNADHIKRFSEYPELRFDINNGRTLCLDCHMKTDTWSHRKPKQNG